MLAALFMVWALATPLYFVYKPPSALIRYFQSRWPDVLWSVKTSKRMIALTIDDAPSEHTQEILDVLRENDVKATFFVIGSQAVGQEAMLQSLIRSGCELGNHAMYDEPSRSLSTTMLTEQIHQVEEMLDASYAAVEGASSPAPRYFRPGSGFFSTAMRQLVGRLGYRLVLGNIYPHDPQIPYANVNASHILSMLQPGGIIICHDRRSWTVPMLRKVLPEMKRRGYEVVTISELLREEMG
ncbi:hypothetical protein NW754_008125 [Fusarium falciforme]|nr:hypothetical protein NW754_008125 [Fusarium falciforme]